MDMSIEETNAEVVITAPFVTFLEIDVCENWVDSQSRIFIAVLVVPYKSWSHVPLTPIPVVSTRHIVLSAIIWIGDTRTLTKICS